MKCEKARKLISPYIDGELSEDEKNKFEGHMTACKECRIAVEEMQGLSQLFVNTEEFKAPEGFHSKVMANVDTSKAGRLFWVPLPVRFAEAVMVLVIVAAGIMSGTVLVKGLMPLQARDVMASLSLDVFDPTPPGTLGGAYLVMTEVRNEK